MTGADLRSRLITASVSQVAFASLASVNPRTVRRWIATQPPAWAARLAADLPAACAKDNL